MAPSEKTDKSDSLREQGGAVVSGVRAAALHATKHVEAVAELLMLELSEYGRTQMRRAIGIAVGAVFLLIAYVMLCWLVVCCCGMMGVIIVIAFNLLVGVVFLVCAMNNKPEGIAPATCQEIKDDLQCIRLYLKGKEKS